MVEKGRTVGQYDKYVILFFYLNNNLQIFLFKVGDIGSIKRIKAQEKIKINICHKIRTEFA